MPVAVETTIVNRPAAPIVGIPTLDRTFVVGLAERGPVNTATRITNPSDYVRVFGDEVTYSEAYKAIRYSLAEETTELWFVRAAGPSAAVATVSQASAVRWDAANPGAWGANLTVTVAAGTLSGKLITVKLAGVTVESHDNVVATGAAAAAKTWTYIAPVALGATALADAVYTLVGGDDDRASVVWSTAINTGLPATLGTGAVIVPGLPYSTTVGAGTLASVLEAHCLERERVYYPEAAATAVEADMQNAATALRSSSNKSGLLIGPRPTATSAGATVTVPPSAIAAAARARAHRQWGYGAGIAAAGPLQTVSGVSAVISPSAVSAATDTYKYAPIVVDGGVVRIMGERSLSTNDAWTRHAVVDLANILSEGAKRIGRSLQFRPIDGRRHLFDEYEKALRGFLVQFADPAKSAFFAQTNTDGSLRNLGYDVDTGTSVNTPSTIAAGQLNADIYFWPTRSAEYVRIQIVNVA